MHLTHRCKLHTLSVLGGRIVGFTLGLWVAALGGTVWAYFNDRDKAVAGLRKGWQAFEGILPQFAGIIVLISLLLTFLSPATISNSIGSQTGFLGMLLTSLIGAITLIPAFIAFPLAASLRSLGAGTAQIAVFISSLMMVGVVTAPLEARYFGRKTMVLRNTLAYVASFIAGFVVGVVAR